MKRVLPKSADLCAVEPHQSEGTRRRDALVLPRRRTRNVNTLIVSGGETDPCVFGAVPGGVDRGDRLVAAGDAFCSSSAEMHDALLAAHRRGYGRQDGPR